ncbi:MAG: CapA family protein [Lachnospiraceae bacterium]|nr:CapA family protein [Lachnospiraceae bacterium]
MNKKIRTSLSLILVFALISVFSFGCETKQATGGITSEIINLEVNNADISADFWEMLVAENSFDELPPPEPVVTVEYLHILGVGDNLMHEPVMRSGIQADGSYDFTYFYDGIREYLDIADVKIVNQETIMAGDELGFTGYPSFNSPTALADSVVNAGFNVVLHASNHICDKGISGLNNCKKYWDEHHPDTLVVGIYGEEGRNRDIPIIEENGVKFAILNYTYGANAEVLQGGLENHTNMLTTWSDSRYLDYNSLNPEVIEDITNANEIADVVVVCPHWGIEYQTKENAYQDRVAREMVAAGADVIIGTHPHVVQPVEWITADNGNTGICYYSLGNYVSNQYDSITLLEGMAWVTVKKTSTETFDRFGSTVTTEIEVIPEGTGVLPMVLQYHNGNNGNHIDGVVPVEQYTMELANAHSAQNRSGRVATPEWFQGQVNEIFGSYALAVSEIGPEPSN